MDTQRSRRQACERLQPKHSSVQVRGQRFGPHVDQSNRLADGSVTEFTVLLYLNEAGLEGGETVFYGSHGSAPKDDTLRFGPRTGACLVHAHGTRCLTHEEQRCEGGQVPAEDGREFQLARLFC